MCKIVSFMEYKDKRIKKMNTAGPFTLDELMVKFDELSGEEKSEYFLDHEEIEQLLSQNKEIEVPF